MILSGVIDSGTTSFKYDFSIPQIFTVSQISLVTSAKNELEPQRNPLHLFTFPKTGSIPESVRMVVAQDTSIDSRTQTERYPLASDPLKSLNGALNKAREGGVSSILNIISDPAYKDYDASARYSASTPTSGSLEGTEYSIYRAAAPAPIGHVPHVLRSPTR